MARKTATEDIGYAIRDALEGTSIIHIDIIAEDREDPVIIETWQRLRS